MEDRDLTGYKSQFSMGQYDFIRFHELLLKLDALSIELNSGNYQNISVYYACLKTLFRSWRKLINETTKKEIEELLVFLKDYVVRISSVANNSGEFTFPAEVLDKIDKVHDELMDQKQIIGLGIVINKTVTAEERGGQMLDD